MTLHVVPCGPARARVRERAAAAVAAGSGRVGRRARDAGSVAEQNRTSVLFGLLQPGADCYNPRLLQKLPIVTESRLLQNPDCYNPDTPDRVDSELALSVRDC